ncbi:ABC transporter ATP-binding protein [Kitasatospora sp. NPDC049285]|uniref:ABC transporter ATP-binding protein n=1 Tax=Kitasatospora sp. NPDC049285 TaxID=3157096 RepID=UPI0034265EDD
MMNSLAGPSGDPAIRIERLVVRRGDHTVLPGLDLEVARGTVTGLLGPSGCGKTTLLRSVVGVQRTAGGTVTVLGQPAGSAALRNRVGYVTQAPSVYGDLTVGENLDYFAAVLGAPKGDPDRVIHQVGLDAHRRTPVARLSGGQRARVSLAAALLGHPELLVLDEPTVGLDPVLRQELWQLFRSLADAGTTLLVSSHVMDEATRCDLLLLMRDGRLLAHDTPAGLLATTGAPDVDSAFLALVRSPGQPAEETTETTR